MRHWETGAVDRLTSTLALPLSDAVSARLGRPLWSNGFLIMFCSYVIEFPLDNFSPPT